MKYGFILDRGDFIDNSFLTKLPDKIEASKTTSMNLDIEKIERLYVKFSVSKLAWYEYIYQRSCSTSVKIIIASSLIAKAE